MTILLAIESSQRTGGVALSDQNDRIRLEHIGAARHDDELMPSIARLFDAAGLQPADLDAIAVSIGPGGFTGLRLAIAAVKMLALVANAKVLAVPSAHVVAAAVGADAGPGPILVTLAAKRGTFWGTRFARTAERWTPLEGDAGQGRLETADTTPLEGLSAVVGDEHLPPVLRDRCGAGSIAVLEPRHDAAALLAVGRLWLDQGRDLPPDRLGPLYPRPPEAVRRWAERKSRP